MAVIDIKPEPGLERLIRLKLVKRVRNGKWLCQLLRPDGTPICVVYVREEDI